MFFFQSTYRYTSESVLTLLLMYIKLHDTGHNIFLRDLSHITSIHSILTLGRI